MTMNMKSCPFCGNAEDLEVGIGMGDREGTPCYIACPECGARGPWTYVKLDSTPLVILAEAQAEWDRRAGMGKRDE